jgi:hypothetical protein
LANEKTKVIKNEVAVMSICKFSIALTKANPAIAQISSKPILVVN